MPEILMIKKGTQAMKKHTSRREFIKVLGQGILGASFLSPLSKCTQRPKKPNVVLILVDDLGWKDLGCYGNQYYETPNIDLLCQDSMKFTNAYASCAVCSPTRSAILTGRYPTRHGITDWIHHWIKPDPNQQPTGYRGGKKQKLLTPANHLYMEHEEKTIAELLKDEGYATCHVGKWHLGRERWYPETQGFDKNIGGYEQGHPNSYFSPYKNPELKDGEENEYLVDRLGKEAVDFISNVNQKDKPFFLYMSHYAVHTPIQSKKDLIEYFKNKDIPEDRDFHPEYAAMIKSLDQAAGKIISKLKKLDVYNDTVIIFTGDNGGLKLPRGDSEYYWTDNSPLRAGKGYPYEGGIREPFMIRVPGLTKAGTESDAIINSIDVLPTVCDLTPAQLPKKTKIDGKSIVPIIKGKQKGDERTLFWHFPHYWAGGVVAPYSVVRSGKWKMVKWYEDNVIELYNLKKDIGETNELSEKFPEVVKKLDQNLSDWLKETGGKLPKPNPDYQANA